jgi:hypothetical protein
MEANLAPADTKDHAQAALPPGSLLDDAMTLRRVIGEPPLPILTRALHLLRAGLDHPTEEVRQSALWLCRRFAVPDADGIVVPRLFALAHEAPRGEVGMPAGALFNLCTARDAGAVAELFAAKQHLRHDLNDLIDLLVKAISFEDDRLLSTSRMVLAILAGDPVLATLQGELAFGTMSAGEFLDYLRESIRADRIHAGTLQALCGRIESRSQRFKPAEWGMLQQQLATSDAAYLRRIGFSCLLAHTNRRSTTWKPADIAALQAFRADPSPLVAAVAQFHRVQQVDEPDEEE